MEAIYKWLSDAWVFVDGKLSFIKPTGLRIAFIVFIVITIMNIFSNLLPLFIIILLSMAAVFALFKAFHHADDEDLDKPDSN